jgi:CheY-like chemotaxis protein
MPDRVASILFVEDTLDDAQLLQAAFDLAKIETRLDVTRSAEEAIEYLESKGAYTDRDQYPIPALALVDLRLPGMNGLELIACLRQHHDPALRALPLVVLSESENESDIERAYALGANCYVCKPAHFRELTELAQAVSDRDSWTESLRTGIPPGPPAGEPPRGPSSPQGRSTDSSFSLLL